MSQRPTPKWTCFPYRLSDNLEYSDLFLLFLKTKKNLPFCFYLENLDGSVGRRLYLNENVNKGHTIYSVSRSATKCIHCETLELHKITRDRVLGMGHSRKVQLKMNFIHV